MTSPSKTFTSHEITLYFIGKALLFCLYFIYIITLIGIVLVSFAQSLNAQSTNLNSMFSIAMNLLRVEIFLVGVCGVAIILYDSFKQKIQISGFQYVTFFLLILNYAILLVKLPDFIRGSIAYSPPYNHIFLVSVLGSIVLFIIFEDYWKEFSKFSIFRVMLLIAHLLMLYLAPFFGLFFPIILIWPFVFLTDVGKFKSKRTLLTN